MASFETQPNVVSLAMPPDDLSDFKIMCLGFTVSARAQNVFEFAVLEAANHLHKLYCNTFRIREFNHVSLKNILLLLGFKYRVENGRLLVERDVQLTYQRIVPGILIRNGWKSLGARRVYGKDFAVRPFMPEADEKINRRVLSRKRVGRND